MNWKACMRFFAPRYPFDYQFCYLPAGHDGPCVFEKRRPKSAAPSPVSARDEADSE